MVVYMNGFVHLPDCQPEVRLLPALPEFSRVAGWVYKLPEKIRGAVERYTGRVQFVKEIDKQGEQTGEILGFFFTPRQPKEAA